MKKIKELYLPLQVENEYKDIDEKRILSELLVKKEGALEKVISGIINEEVVEHMHLSLDSTIMQMLVLNDHLINLFMKNFEALSNNYIINGLEERKMIELDEKKLEIVKETIKNITIKTNLEDLNKKIDEIALNM